ncbi:DUF3379 family protein [Povalibacter uvarum]|nr:DUF3379 family protein [Povalibacter uvarum]
MNCLEFRRTVGAEPHSAAPEIAQHAAQCPACARYWREMQQMDSLIHRAFAIDADTVARPDASRRRALRFGLAASVMLAIAMAVLWIAYPRDTLAEEVVQHALHEPGSLRTTPDRVSEMEFVDVLARSGLRLRPGFDGRVSYATNCPFRGREVPHFVVQTSQGPATVMLLTEEKAVWKPQHFDEEGFRGVIMPAPRGVLAVLGQDVPVDQVAQQVLAAVEYAPAMQW